MLLGLVYPTCLGDSSRSMRLLRGEAMVSRVSYGVLTAIPDPPGLIIKFSNCSLSFSVNTTLLFIWGCFCSGIILTGIVLAKPKSQSFTSHRLVIRTFAGLMSLWNTLAVCRKLRLHSRLYMIATTCSSSHWGSL
jgi:hypothetical protein